MGEHTAIILKDLEYDLLSDNKIIVAKGSTIKVDTNENIGIFHGWHIELCPADYYIIEN